MAIKKAAGPKAKAPAKPAPRKKSRKKAVSALKRVENAILTTVAEVDELALDMGLLGATPPKKKTR